MWIIKIWSYVWMCTLGTYVMKEIYIAIHIYILCIFILHKLYELRKIAQYVNK